MVQVHIDGVKIGKLTRSQGCTNCGRKRGGGVILREGKSSWGLRGVLEGQSKVQRC